MRYICIYIYIYIYIYNGLYANIIYIKLIIAVVFLYILFLVIFVIFLSNSRNNRINLWLIRIFWYADIKGISSYLFFIHKLFSCSRHDLFICNDIYSASLTCLFSIIPIKWEICKRNVIYLPNDCILT